jgi:hypothetical protein
MACTGGPLGIKYSRTRVKGPGEYRTASWDGKGDGVTGKALQGKQSGYVKTLAGHVLLNAGDGE